jgi:hypothetical protein
MVTAPSLQAEMLRAGALAEQSIAAAVAARIGTDPDTDMYPKLVAATVMAATNVAMQQWMADDARSDMGKLLTDALAQVSAGLPPPGPALPTISTHTSSP